MSSIATAPASQPMQAFPALLICEADRARWQRMAHHARSRGLAVYVGRSEPLERPGLRLQRYEVESGSARGTWYAVHIAKSVDGTTLTLCECAAGRHRKPCSHVARVLTVAGAWPFELQLEQASS